MRISDWSSDVCSSDLGLAAGVLALHLVVLPQRAVEQQQVGAGHLRLQVRRERRAGRDVEEAAHAGAVGAQRLDAQRDGVFRRSEEHTSELQSLMRISYAVFCLKKKRSNP